MSLERPVWEIGSLSSSSLASDLFLHIVNFVIFFNNFSYGLKNWSSWTRSPLGQFLRLFVVSLVFLQSRGRFEDLFRINVRH